MANQKLARYGRQNGNWRGGVKMNEHGYPRVSAGPYRDKLLHLLIFEWFHGPVPAGHTVHHRDGDKLNFHPNNLVALPESEHATITNNKRWRLVAGKRGQELQTDEVPF